MRIPFFGAAYTLDSVNADAQSCVNLIPEVIESKAGKSIGWLRGSPGLTTPFVTLPQSPVIGLWCGEGRMFAAAGLLPTRIYEVRADLSIVDYGAVGNARLDSISGRPDPVTFFPNGNQLLIINGGYAWVGVGNLVYGDLYIVNQVSSSAIITSPSLPFQPNQVGEVLHVTGGGVGVWVPGIYTILAVANGNATVAPSPGSTGASGGLGSITNAAPVQPVLTVATYTDLKISNDLFDYTDLAIGAPVATYADLAIGTTKTYANLRIGWPAVDAYTDLVIGGDGQSLTSAGAPFGPSDVGRSVQITGGINFTPGTYLIVTVIAGVAELDALVGTPAATGGTGFNWSGGATAVYAGAGLSGFGGGDVGNTLQITGGTGFTPGTYSIASVAGSVATLNAPCGIIGSSGGQGTEYLAASNLIVTSAARPFTGGDVGNTLQITGGAGFIPGAYTIGTVFGGKATLSSSPGPVGASGGAAAEFSPASGTQLSSVARPFSAPDVSNTLQVTAGAGFVPGTYTILSVAGGVATLNAAAGVVGASGGSGSEYLAGSNNVVSSAALPFDTSDQGNTLVITGGAGFIPGSRTILSVSSGYATLSTPAGTMGATGGQAIETNGPVQAGTGAFMDTYGIVAAPNQRQFSLSALNNFLSWSAIDTAVKEGQPDNILALLADHEELYLFGDLFSTEVWQDTGNNDSPFRRMPTGFMHYGLAAQFSVSPLGFDGIAWLAWSSGRGAVQAVYAEGFRPQRISTHAIEEVWRTYSTVKDAIAYTEVENGHHSWVIHFPSGDATWVYDLTTSAQMGMPIWHRRGYWDGAVLHRQLQCCHAYGALAFGGAGVAPQHYVGGRTSGAIYVQSLTAYTDNGQPIYRERACPHQSTENLRRFWSVVQLDLEVGNQDLTVTFDYSRDFGHTFINALALTALAVNGFTQRLRWRRLGNARDLVPRFSTLSAAKIAWTDAWAEEVQGNS